MKLLAVRTLDAGRQVRLLMSFDGAQFPDRPVNARGFAVDP
jgi:hypothetical protein